MKKTIEIIDYEPEHGLRFIWEPGSIIECKVTKGTINLIANDAGLVSLARHLLTLAQESIPSGIHLHLDDSNGLDSSDCELIIEKK
jgi:hypothetical protein